VSSLSTDRFWIAGLAAEITPGMLEIWPVELIRVWFAPTPTPMKGSKVADGPAKS
jgi:hypothetical protein